MGNQWRLERTAVSAGSESYVIIKSWVWYLDYFEDLRYKVNNMK